MIIASLDRCVHKGCSSSHCNPTWAHYALTNTSTCVAPLPIHRLHTSLLLALLPSRLYKKPVGQARASRSPHPSLLSSPSARSTFQPASTTTTLIDYNGCCYDQSCCAQEGWLEGCWRLVRGTFPLPPAVVVAIIDVVDQFAMFGENYAFVARCSSSRLIPTFL